MFPSLGLIIGLGIIFALALPLGIVYSCFSPSWVHTIIVTGVSVALASGLLIWSEVRESARTVNNPVCEEVLDQCDSGDLNALRTTSYPPLKT